MKNNKKRQIFAGKLLLGVFILMMGFFIRETKADFTNFENECALKTTVWGCTFKDECVWTYGKYNDGEKKCIPKITKTNIKAESKWTTKDCNKKYLKNENTLVSYRLKIEEENELLPISSKNACKKIVIDQDKDPELNMHICDYLGWLSNKGKKKCRKYVELKNKAASQLCLQDVEIRWQASLKDGQARESREKELEDCNYISYVDESYSGPVFDGPGLSGGAMMAQAELSNSISKQRDIKKLLISWSKFAIEIAIVLAVIAIIWAGIRFITDMGDGAGVEAAKKIIMWTIVGLILIMGSYAIVNTVIKARFGSDLSYNITTNHFIT